MRLGKQGIVSPDDAFVIAINPRQLGHEFADTHPPRILQAAVPLGAPYVTIDPKTMKAIGSGYQSATKSTKRPVRR
jgi:hypothetical protein